MARGYRGTVLDGLEAEGLKDNTVVLLHGDHGWQLGEHGEWCKQTTFELATRVPLMIRMPGAAGVRPFWARFPSFGLL